MAEARRTTNDEAMLGRLDERTVNLALAFKELQVSHVAATKDLKDYISGGQAANRADTEKMLHAIQLHMTEDTTRFERHDERLKVLENWRWYILGAIATSGFVIWLFK